MTIYRLVTTYVLRVVLLPPEAWHGNGRRSVVYCSGTIEEKIYHRQIFKQVLTNRVLSDPNQRRLFNSRDLRSLFTLNDDDEGASPCRAVCPASTAHAGAPLLTPHCTVHRGGNQWRVLGGGHQARRRGR